MSVSGAGKSGGSSHSSNSKSARDGVAGPSSSRSSTSSKASSKSGGSKAGSSKAPSKAAASKAPSKTAKKAPGVNPKLAAAVKAINISQYRAKNKTTYCNQAVNAYAQKLGYKNFKGLNANQMYAQMSKPGSGWRKATAAEAMAAARQGKLSVAGWTGKVHGHVAAVIGEYAKGVPAIAQAGGHVTKAGKTVDNTFEYGSINRTRKDPSYFVHD